MDAAIGNRMRRDGIAAGSIDQAELRYLYVVESGLAIVKVGFTVNPMLRLKTLQAASSHELRLKHVVPVARSKAAMVEKRAHELLSSRRMSGEWFAVHPATAYEAIARAMRESECSTS